MKDLGLPPPLQPGRASPPPPQENNHHRHHHHHHHHFNHNHYEHCQHNLKKVIAVMSISVWNLQRRLIHRLAHRNTRSPFFVFFLVFLSFLILCIESAVSLKKLVYQEKVIPLSNQIIMMIMLFIIRNDKVIMQTSLSDDQIRY